MAAEIARIPVGGIATRVRRRGILARWMALPVVLWALLWVSINTGPWNFQDAWTGISGMISAARAALPLAALGCALLILTGSRRRPRRTWAEKGFWIYGLVMLAACTTASSWFEQAYWGFAFLATMAVVELGMRRSDPLGFLFRLNWASWAATTAALAVMLIVARNVLYDPQTQSGYGLINRFQTSHSFGISRETGLSRMAVVPALVALVYLFNGRWLQKLLAAAILAGSVWVIWIMQSRGALFSFLGAFLFVLFFGGKWARRIGLAMTAVVAVFAVVGLSSQGLMHDLWQHATRDQGLSGFSDMSGRDVIRDNVIARWQASPLFGYGPQADRVFVEIDNAQNAVLYALLCAGLVGATFFVIGFAAAWRALLNLLSSVGRLPLRERTMIQITGAILVFSTLRSIPENEAGLFSVDLLLQYPAMVYLAVLSLALRQSATRRMAPPASPAPRFGLRHGDQALTR